MTILEPQLRHALRVTDDLIHAKHNNYVNLYNLYINSIFDYIRI